MTVSTSNAPHPVVDRAAWLETRRALLQQEKAFMQQKDALNAERLRLPWVRLEKDYLFDSPEGPRRLSELFAGRSQLYLYHFMFGPEWEQGCVGCSFMADHFDGALPHLNYHDVTLVAVSRAPLDKIQAFKRRMGWHFPWVSSASSDFNFDFQASFTPEQLASGKAFYNFEEREVDCEELPGSSAFYRDADGTVYHTYSSYSRGGETVMSTYGILDMMPLGRNEEGDLSTWVRHHDRYEAAPTPCGCGH
ncbi:MAG: thioredoxin family protein [Verrucomicrobiota bacterium JB022]|nr:thioredoxin family protein [Verrucomicrobiota bacterium JB022]